MQAFHPFQIIVEQIVEFPNQPNRSKKTVRGRPKIRFAI